MGARKGIGLLIAVLSLSLTAFTPQSVSDYRLASADKVRIDVFGEAALGGEFVIDANGRITLPLIGEVQAAGLTGAQL